jgi:hypothetical protein
MDPQLYGDEGLDITFEICRSFVVVNMNRRKNWTHLETCRSGSDENIQ